MDGWQEFANHYSIKRGHVLVFKYKGNSKFRVVICDYSTCEIDYPSNPIQCDEHDQLNNNDVENQRSKRKEVEEGNFKSPSPSSRPNKRKRTSPSGTTQSNSPSPRPKDNFHFYRKDLSF